MNKWSTPDNFTALVMSWIPSHVGSRSRPKFISIWFKSIQLNQWSTWDHFFTIAINCSSHMWDRERGQSSIHASQRRSTRKYMYTISLCKTIYFERRMSLPITCKLNTFVKHKKDCWVEWIKNFCALHLKVSKTEGPLERHLPVPWQNHLYQLF